jgi:hypothetical protein
MHDDYKPIVVSAKFIAGVMSIGVISLAILGYIIAVFANDGRLGLATTIFLCGWFAILLIVAIMNRWLVD